MSSGSGHGVTSCGAVGEPVALAGGGDDVGDTINLRLESTNMFKASKASNYELRYRLPKLN